ncbi:carbohydrate sulfotransferase 1-like [Glandiceps talaboti]
MGNTRNVRKLSANILIIAGARTGSSFVGDIFQSNPTVFYIFEPLGSLKDIVKTPEMSVVGVDLLAKIYDCNFSEYAQQWDEYFKWLSPIRLSQTMTKCTPLITRRQAVGRCCQKTQHRAAKTIRLLDVRDLIPLMESPTVNLKVINVVRDPRAMMSSFIPMYYSNWIENTRESNKVWDAGVLNEHLTDTLIHYCEQMLRNYILFTANSSQAWKDNFKILRFEDIALNPREYADIMYSHVGIDIDSEVYQWIDKHTQSNEKQHGGFGTIRNSTSVVNDWRKRVTFKLVDKMQNHTMCREYMNKLHYVFVENFTMLRDETIPLLTSLR